MDLNQCMVLDLNQWYVNLNQWCVDLNQYMVCLLAAARITGNM